MKIIYFYYYSDNIEGQSLRCKERNLNYLILCKYKFLIGSILYAGVHLLNWSPEKWQK